MPVYRIADYLIDIECRYEFTPNICVSYLAEEGHGEPDFYIRVPDEKIAAAKAAKDGFSDGYYESLCIYRAICDTLAAYGTIVLHAAVIQVDGKAYAFSAPSGTGKSTHIKLWRKVYGEKVGIINGDKPLLKKMPDGSFVAYGTPWCGKESWHANTSAPLAALCFLERAPQNSIRRLSSEEAVDRMFAQLIKPTNANGVEETLCLIDALIRRVPIYLLSCNMEDDAARLAYETMTEQA